MFLGNLTVVAGVDTGLGEIKVEIGSASETVEVSAGSALVETTQAQVTNTFQSAYLNNIPGIQENQGLDVLAVLLPGVSATRDLGYSNTNGVGFSVNGLRGRRTTSRSMVRTTTTTRWQDLEFLSAIRSL